MSEDKNDVVKIKVQRKALKIDDLPDKVRFAVDKYKKANDMYQKGLDSVNEWNMVIKALCGQLREIKDYIAVANHNLGVVYASKENFTLAIESFNKAIEYKEDYAVAHNNLSIVYRKLGDHINADRHEQEAKRLGFVPKSKA